MADRAADPDPSPPERGTPHPANTLNELSGEEWLYFTKSVWSTAYPSELGHARRKAHGANKPPRLMCRLIEFFTRTGELVLDPFAGVGGTLLGAAIAQGPRRALGIELDRRWIDVYDAVLGELRAERAGRGPVLADLGPNDPGGARTFDPTGLELRQGDALAILPTLTDASVDFVATDPPYNVQLPLTMAGGRLAETHANRRTDYAMVSDDPADLANSPDYPTFLDRMETSAAGSSDPDATPRSSSVTPTRKDDTCSPAPTWRRGPSGWAWSPRATSPGTRRGPACVRMGTRTRSCRTSPTSTSWSCAGNAEVRRSSGGW